MTEPTTGQAFLRERPIDERLAGAPISWGVCEIPGWGLMAPADRVLGEMAALGLHGTELGPPGFLPSDPGALRELLGHHGLALVGGFQPLVLHERSAAPARSLTGEAARRFARAGGEMLVVALVEDLAWSAPGPLDAAGWSRVAAHLEQVAELAGESGVTVALHPHAGTLVETAEQVDRALEATGAAGVGWCLDTGHLLIGGTDPAAFAHEHGERVVHVHLKDVDAAIAGRLRAGELTLLSATRQGLFRPLGNGDAGIGAVLDALEGHGYDRWLVLEQDTAITAEEPAVGSGPMRDARQSIAFLHESAQTTTQEVHR